MKIKLDENIPSDLKMAGDVDTVEQEGLAGRDDATVWRAAQSEGRFLVTQDLDFSDLRRFQLGTHCGILLLRLSNPSRQHYLHVSKRFSEVSNWSHGRVALLSRPIQSYGSDGPFSKSATHGKAIRLALMPAFLFRQKAPQDVLHRSA